MSYQTLPNGVTICEDTPQNWQEFYEAKARICGLDTVPEPWRSKIAPAFTPAPSAYGHARRRAGRASRHGAGISIHY